MANNIRISMDGRGHAQDNIFIEPLWTLKYQYVYLHVFDAGSQLRTGIKQWFAFYSGSRPHQSIDNRTPEEVYLDFFHPVARAA